MTSFRLALTELRRVTVSRLGRLALVAMILVPSIYGGLYLWANKDPYANMKGVPAAIVDEDAGTTLSTGEELRVGDKVATSLVDSKSFAWQQVGSEEARQGLEDGRFDFAIVIPKGFSADLASSADLTPRQATLELRTNDANGYLSRTIANQVVAQVTRSIASEVTQTAANQLLVGFSTIHDKIGEAAKGANDLAKGATSAATGAADLAKGADQLVAGEKKLVGGTDQLASGAGTLSSGLASAKQQTAALPGQTRALADGARQVADGNAKIAATGTQVADASGKLVTDLTAIRGDLATRLANAGFTDDQIQRVLTETDRLAAPVRDANTKIQQASSDLTRLSAGAGQVADGADRLADAMPALTSGIAKAADGAAALKTGSDQLATGQRDALDGATQLASGAHKLSDGNAQIRDGATQLAKGLDDGVKSIPDPSEAQRTAVAQTLGNPVGLKNDFEAAAATYGAGLAPFFMSLALWIGGFVLFTRLRALSTRAIAAGQPAWRIAIGGWMTPMVLGLAQALVAYAVIALGVGIDVAHPVWLLLFMWLVSASFMAIIHGLMARLGVVGQFVGLVFMVLQLVSAGGTFPWQTLPGPLQWLHHAVPMSYAVDGIRRLMYGGSFVHLGLDLAVLAAYAVGGLLLATAGARLAGTWTAERIRPEIAPV